MISASVSQGATWLRQGRIRHTGPAKHIIVARLVAGIPLFLIGLAHVFVPEAAMRPMVEAAGFPFPAVVSPVGVAMQVVGGFSLLIGWWARIGALLATPTMVGAIYAHIVIDVWPGVSETGPPDALPVVVLAGAVYVLWRGAGRWSLDRRHVARTAPAS